MSDLTNLTDAQLTALATEHYPNPDDPDGCWSCCEAWVCPTALALAELRELRAKEQPARTLSDLADQLERGVPIDWPQEQLLMATLVTYYKADNAGVRSSWGEALAFINTIAKERNKLRAENERLRVSYARLRAMYVGEFYQDDGGGQS